MLAPGAAPQAHPRSWDEAVTYLRARSTDLQIALDQVLQAEAQTRIALAQYLPSLHVDRHHEPPAASRRAASTSRSGGALVQHHDVHSGNLQLQQTHRQRAAVRPDQHRRARTRTPVAAVGRRQEAHARAEPRQPDRRRRARPSAAPTSTASASRWRSSSSEITRRKQALGAANGLDVVRAEQNAANARADAGERRRVAARGARGAGPGARACPEETGVAPDVNIDGLARSAMAVVPRW